MLVKLNYPLVTQPAITSFSLGMLATRIPFLRMQDIQEDMRFPTYPIAAEVPRTEVQAPILSTKLWSAFHKRLSGGDLAVDWYLDAFWDSMAVATKRLCGRNASLKIGMSPVRHMNFHNLQRSILVPGQGQCTVGPGRDYANCRNVSADEGTLAWKVIEDVCGPISEKEHWPVIDAVSRAHYNPNCSMEEVRLQQHQLLSGSDRGDRKLSISWADLVEGLTGSVLDVPDKFLKKRNLAPYGTAKSEDY